MHPNTEGHDSFLRAMARRRANTGLTLKTNSNSKSEGLQTATFGTNSNFRAQCKLSNAAFVQVL